MTTEDRIIQDANSFSERYWISDYLLETTFIELMIQERNKTIDEVNYIIIEYLNDGSDNALQAFNERILSLKVTPKK